MLDLPHLAQLMPALARPLHIIDLETTGFFKPGIVEFACLTMTVQGQCTVSSTLLNPGKRIDPRATDIHGIRDSDVAGKDSLSSHLPLFDKMYREGVISGFNIGTYDLRVLNANALSFKRPLPASPWMLDVREIWMGLTGRTRGKLVELAEHYKVTMREAHRAEADVLMTAQVLDAMIAEHGVDTIETYLRLA